jgi:hypothetical protein
VENSIEEDIKIAVDKFSDNKDIDSAMLIVEKFILGNYILLGGNRGNIVKDSLRYILSDYKRVLRENNRLEEQVEYDKTHIYTPQTIELNFISKSKIEDKIEELKKNLHTVEHYETVGAIHVLQELLEENENHIPRIN